MFTQNKYTRVYYQIIDRARDNTKQIGFEHHHILPNCLGGTASKENMVWISGREHFICHWLLSKMTSGQNNIKMLFALNGMKRISGNQNRYNTKITSRVYARIKLELATHMSTSRKGKSYEELYGIEKAAEMRAKKALPRGKQSAETIAKRVAKLTGRHNTDEQKQKMSDSQKGRPAILRSDEEKEKISKKISEALTGKSKSEEHKKKLSEIFNGRSNGKRSEETKQKMRKPKSEAHRKAISEARIAKYAALRGNSTS